MVSLTALPAAAVPAVLDAARQALTMQLGLTCVLLFVGALVAGSIPLCISVSERWLGVAAAFSAGLLVGAGLSIVIPEGFEAFHNTQADGDSVMPDGLAGTALLVGFLAMLILDQLQGDSHGHKHSLQRVNSSDEDLEDPLTTSSGPSHIHKRARGAGMDSGMRALIGLLIHSLADGLAVGAATHGGNAQLVVAVAFAMVLHKAPTALGLSTFLVSAHWPKAKVLKGLTAFAAASPIAAIVTAVMLTITPFVSHPAGAALCVIFSGGTFLYAACMHVLPEAKHIGPGSSLSRAQVIAIVVGSLLPLGIPFFGGHH